MFAKFHSHLRGGTQITRVLGIPGGYPGIPKTRQPYLEGIPISLGIWIWGYPKHGDTQITVTADRRNHFERGEGPGDEVGAREFSRLSPESLFVFSPLSIFFVHAPLFERLEQLNHAVQNMNKNH